MATKVRSAFERLSKQRQIFVAEYAADLKLVRAATEAGYAQPSVAGAKLLKNPQVKAALAEVLGPAIEKALLSPENIVQQLSNFLFMDPIELFNSDGSVKDIHKIPEQVRQCIVSFDVDEEWEYDEETDESVLTGKKIRIKTIDKTKALSLAMQYRKLLDPAQTNINIGVDATGFWKEFDKRALGEVPPAVDAKIVGPTHVTNVNGRP